MIEEEITEKSVKKRGEVLCGEEILESSISEGPSVLTMHQQLRAYREKQQQKFRVKSQNGTTTPINKDNNGNSENEKTNNQEFFRGQSARFKEAHKQQSRILTCRERKSGLHEHMNYRSCTWSNY